MSKEAILAAGTIVEFDVGMTGTGVEIEGVMSIGLSGEVKEAKDKTTLADTIKKSMGGIADPGDASIGGQFFSTAPGQKAFRDAVIAESDMEIKVTFPDGTTAAYEYHPRGWTIEEPTGSDIVMFKVEGSKNSYTEWTFPAEV